MTNDMNNENRAIWYIYIIKTTDGLFYTGITTNLERRFLEHSRSKTKGAKFFRIHSPEKIVYVEESLNRSEATKRERTIKKFTKEKKKKIIEQYACSLNR